MGANVWERWRERVDDRLGDPIWWNDVLQLAKTVLAAVAAWVIAASVLDLPQPFLAPWAALLVVHATVYRTFSKGMQQVAATVVAVLLATVVGEAFGLTTGAITLLLVVALVLGAVPWLGAEATTIATTGLVVLTTGFEDDVMLVARLLDTAIGVAVGLLVNVLVWPPLRRHTAAKALDRVDDGIGELLADMAGGLGDGCQDEDVTGWIDRTRDLDGDLDQAWALVRQAEESARMNPRRSARVMKNPRAVARAAASHGAGRRRDPEPGPHARRSEGAPRDVGRGLRGAVDLDARRHGAGDQRRRPGRRCSTYAAGSRRSPRSSGPPSARPSGRSTGR